MCGAVHCGHWASIAAGPLGLKEILPFASSSYPTVSIVLLRPAGSFHTFEELDSKWSALRAFSSGMHINQYKSVFFKFQDSPIAQLEKCSLSTNIIWEIMGAHF